MMQKYSLFSTFESTEPEIMKKLAIVKINLNLVEKF